MENRPHAELKTVFFGKSGKTLNFTCRRILSKLNYQQEFQSQNGFCRDYRGLAEVMGFYFHEIQSFEKDEDIMLKILEAWEARPDATLDKLIGYLEAIDRNDIIEELIPILEFIKYDAYVSYAEEDVILAEDLVQKLESPEIGLKLFICARDMLHGCHDIRNDAELMKDSFKHVLILLTPNFMKSPESKFLTNFAGSLTTEEKQRILIPVILKPCEIPHTLYYVPKVDFTKEYNIDWMWKRLICSILPV